ncbi:MAG: Uma2 family endonuclease, partial [bacterium]|nr:Uma2 family endonuclease [bacterium]
MRIDEFEQLPDDDQLHELDEGELITMAPASGTHGRIESHIMWVLRKFLEEHAIGELLTSDTGFILSRDPDVVR